MRIDLPELDSSKQPAFTNLAGARRWLAELPLVQIHESAQALMVQIAALDSASLAPGERLAVLDVLRRTAMQLQGGLEARFARKPLPLSADFARDFTLSSQLWRTLAIAYLRPAAAAGAEAVTFLHRATVTLRLEQYGHFLAAYEVPDALYQFLYGALAVADSMGLLRTPVKDPELGFAEDSHIAGHAAWAFLLAASDPYRLSLPQLAVANRGLSRWRDLAALLASPPEGENTAISLACLLPNITLPDRGPRWLDVRPVLRKVRGRIRSLAAGEAPESLKLGRELSSEACVDLLKILDQRLRTVDLVTHRTRPVQLAFGMEQAYVAIEGRPVTPYQPESTVSRARMEVFGFDARPVVEKSQPITETWELGGNRLWRPASGERHRSPTLAVLLPATPGDGVRLGTVEGLRIATNGGLAGILCLHPELPAAVRLRSGKSGGQRIPAFLLAEAEGYSLIVPPTAGVRPHTNLALDDSPIEFLRVGEVVERGSDFIRHLCQG